MEQNIKKYEINGNTVWIGRLSKVNGVVQDETIPYRICPLNINDAEIMGDFSRTIYENLRTGEECFIHKHSKEYYHQVFANPRVKYFGVFVGKKLVGMSSLTICNNQQELNNELPNSAYDFFDEKRNNGNNRIASLGSDSVLPEYRGNGLNAIMIEYRLDQAIKLGCTDCTSIVDRNNRWNMTPYFYNRFNLYETTIDPSDGGSISLLHKPVEKETVLSCFKPRTIVQYNDLQQIDSLLQKGFIGIEFDGKTGNVTFAHSNYYNPQKYTPSMQFLQQILQQNSTARV